MKREYETQIRLRLSSAESPNHGSRTKAGSALLLAVVLTSLLAIVGVTFLMVARVDKIATSSISENRELNSAVETIIAKISQELVFDTPGVLGQEYYDYPDLSNPWLANLEPYQGKVDPNKYYWRQVSDTYNKFVPPVPSLRAIIINDYQEPVEVGDSNSYTSFYSADADGDGVSDSVWVQLPNMTTSKGKPIFAAIRVIDNGGMLNVNTAYEFDANETSDSRLIDGSRLAQIHMLDFVKGISDDVDALHRFRCDGDEPDLLTFNDECAIRIENPDRTNINYLPYDIGDELELRNRFVLDAQYNIARIEAALPITLTYPKGTTFGNRFAPIDSSGDFADWKRILNPFDPNDSYNFRHLLTTYNMDRIINPNGAKMANINIPDVAALNAALLADIDPNATNREALAAQLAVNIADFIDDDTEPTIFEPNDPNIPTGTYYGFEAQPFVAEIGMNVIPTPSSIDYAVELYNPFSEPIYLHNFMLEFVCGGESDDIRFDPCDIISANGGCFVIASNLAAFGMVSGPSAKEDGSLTFFGSWEPIDPTVPPPPVPPGPGPGPPQPPAKPAANGNLFLKRRVYMGDPNDPNTLAQWIYTDKQVVDANVVDPNGGELYFGRDVRDWHIVYPADSNPDVGSLGSRNLDESAGHNFSFFLPNPLSPPSRFITVGDIPRILTIGNGTNPDSTIGERLQMWPKDQEYRVRLDLQNPYYKNVFRYLTVFDPSSDYINNDGDPNTDEIDLDKTPELKIPGRININTAPWYVIAQLPWVSGELAQAIVAYRDKLQLLPNVVDYSVGRGKGMVDLDPNSLFPPAIVREELGFSSIGELLNVTHALTDERVAPYDHLYDVRRYGRDSTDQLQFPDLTPGDDVKDDFEERDVIFSRRSNLVTVRSDVFTAYILVRIGTDGPQKRVVAILDRSGVYPDGLGLGSVIGNVKVIALHPVPDPR